MFGTPPNPPPPNTPAIEPDLRGKTTIREQLAAHREEQSCASCHAAFDPPGFALEAYDVIGGRRSFYRSTEGAKTPDVKQIFRSYLTPTGEFKGNIPFRDGMPVDSSGELTDGRDFQSFREYQALLTDHTAMLSRNLANQMVMYFTGAPVTFADRDAVEDILKHAGGTNPNLHELIHQVIQSPLFLQK